MELRSVKGYINKIVYYDIGQINLMGKSIEPFIFTACILRKKNKNEFYYQAELKEISKDKKEKTNSVIIVPLEKVIVQKMV